MIIQLLIGLLVSVVNIMVHALATVGAISAARFVDRRCATWPRRRLMSVMVTTVLVMMLAHIIEIVVWSLSYALIGVVPEGSDFLYFAFVNYTTLGYGDVIPVKTWQLLGPMAAMTGILMFGWSTAVLFEVLLKAVAQLGSVAGSHSPFNSVDRG